MLPRLVLTPGSSLTEAMRRLDETRQGIVLVVDDEGRLVGTITDGDLRRAVLDGSDLSSPVELLLARKASTPYARPISVPTGTSKSEIAELMERHTIRQVPVVDAEGRPVDLVTAGDLLSRRMGLSAVVMAGGRGERLSPLTDEVPKPMLPLAGRPVLDYIVAQLRGADVRDIIITTHYLAEQIEDYFLDGGEHQVNITYAREEKPLGTAGSLGVLPPPTGPLLVINGDVVTDLDFVAFHEFHIGHKAAMTVAIRRMEHEIPYGVVEISGTAVTGIREKPSFPYFVNAGVYLCQPEVVSLIPRGVRFDMTQLMEAILAGGGSVAAFPVWEYWRDIGSGSEYVRLQRDAEEGRLH
jgi:dTDP-glucose pyrophosphorylase/CBS domain-containing protein